MHSSEAVNWMLSMFQVLTLYTAIRLKVMNSSEGDLEMQLTAFS
jgi:hypothetical protein